MGKQAAARRKRREGNALWNEIRRQGVMDRVETTLAAMNSASFRARFQRTVAAVKGTERDPKDAEGVRALALAALAEVGVDTADVLLTLQWRPELNGQLTFVAHPHPDAIRRAQAVVEERAKAA